MDKLCITMGIIIVISLLIGFKSSLNHPRVSDFCFTLGGFMLLLLALLTIDSVKLLILIAAGTFFTIILRKKNSALAHIILVIIGVGVFAFISTTAAGI